MLHRMPNPQFDVRDMSAARVKIMALVPNGQLCSAGVRDIRNVVKQPRHVRTSTSYDLLIDIARASRLLIWSSRECYENQAKMGDC